MHQLYLKNAVPVGRSTDGGEVTRYIGRHGTKRVAKAVLMSAIPAPTEDRSESEGIPPEVWDGYLVIASETGRLEMRP